MKPRDRQATGGNAPQATLAAAPSKPPANGTPSYQSGNGFLWEDWYRHASPDQQAEVLDLARRQGLLYLHQIPPHANNGTHHASSVESQAEPQILKDLLAGQPVSLVPVVAQTVEVVDQELDSLQRQAVARALATPDVCLIQGPPGTGKSRVAQEILLQASRRGLRVLFLAQHAACVDGVLDQLARHDGLLPIRLISPCEEVPSPLRRMLLSERVGSFRSEILEKADRSRTRSEEVCRERQCQADVWPALTTLLEQRCQTQERLQQLTEELARVAAEVESAQSRGDGALGAALAELASKKDADLQLGRKNIEELDRQTQTLQEEEAALHRQRQAGGGWLAWLLNLFTGKSSAARQQADARLQAIGTLQTELKERRLTLESQNRQIEQTFKTEHSRRLHEEIARRQGALSQQQADLRARLQRTEEEWQTLTGKLHPENLRPGSMAAADIEEARRLWQGQKQLDEENCLLARQWVAFLQESGESLAARLPGLAGIVAGSLAAWNHEGGAIPGSFDLLLVDEADRIPEATLLLLARKAQRWVFIGNYLGQPTAPASAPANPREVRPAAPRTAAFTKLWNLLHADPSKLPYTWGQDNGRLVCQFRPLSPQELGRLERESLADAADIELRILTLPRSEPVLAQVAFPADTPLAAAKEFVFREMQEIPVQSCGRNGWIDEQASSFTWRLLPHPAAAGCDPQPAALEPGVTEWLHRDQTLCLEFAKDRWDRPQVVDWLKRRFHHSDLGRTMFLQVPHRMESNLAAWVGDVLFPGALFPVKETTSRDASVPGRLAAAVAFVPVTADAGRGKKSPRENISLEIDLAAGRGTERVPQDLLAGLSRQGFVNYHEAQAVVRTLETLPQTPGCLGVIAFHAAQVELIRRLLARSPTLSLQAINVGLPGHFLHGQCQVAVVSLTRSNTQRSGLFAAEAADPILALTRAREQLFLVGDPDTLMRWSTGQEPADSSDAGREKHWLRKVARYLRSEGLHQNMFQMCESRA